MGMDVYGKKPSSEAGKYFRANVWCWRPLWDYCEEVAPGLTAKVTYGQSNDGDGLGARDSKRLAAILTEHLDDGSTAAYAAARDDENRRHTRRSVVAFPSRASVADSREGSL